jgi:hypothetical protein
VPHKLRCVARILMRGMIKQVSVFLWAVKNNLMLPCLCHKTGKNLASSLYINRVFYMVYAHSVCMSWAHFYSLLCSDIWRSWIHASWYNYEYNQRDATI